MEVIHRDTDYAVRAAACLASSGEMLSTSALAANVGVPVVFLRKIMQRLRNAGIVRSARGPFGGYVLAREVSGITLYEIITAMQGPIYMNSCFANPGYCENSGACGLQSLLSEMEHKLRRNLQSITLADIIQRLDTVKTFQLQ